jgi:hypothetical protein
MSGFLKLNFNQYFGSILRRHIHQYQLHNLSSDFHYNMKLLLVAVLLCILHNGGVQGRIANLAQLEALQAMSMSPYPWTDWVKFKAAMNGVPLTPIVADQENTGIPVTTADEEDDDDDVEDNEQDPEVIEFLKRAAAAEDDSASSGKKSKKTKAAKGKKAPKLKPWEAAVAAKKAAASTTTTPAPTPEDFQISYSELVKAILAAHDEETGEATATAGPTTTTEAPFDPENINYDELAKAILGVEKQRQEAAATAEKP